MIWLAKSFFPHNLKPTFFPDMWFSLNHKDQYGPFFQPKKSTHQRIKYFAKYKTSFLGYFWALFPKWGFSYKIWLCQLFTFRSMERHVEFQKNPMSHFNYWHIDITTYWQWWFHRIPYCLQAGGLKLNFGTPTVFEINKFQKHLGHVCTILNKII